MRVHADYVNLPSVDIELRNLNGHTYHGTHLLMVSYREAEQ